MTTLNFFRTIGQTFQPKKYNALGKQSLGKICWFLARVLFICSLLIAGWVAVIGYIGYPAITMVVQEAAKELPGMYPDGLVVTVEKGILSTNSAEPVRIALPAKWATLIAKNTQLPKGEVMPTAMLVIDTTKTAEDFPALSTIVLATKTAIVMRDKNGGYRVQPYGKDQKLEITQVKYLDVLKKGEAALPFIDHVTKTIFVFLVIAIPFAAAGFGLLAWMLVSLVVALIMLLWSAILKREWMYNELYRMCLIGVTPIAMIRGIAWIIPGGGWAFPTWLVIVWMGIVIAILPRKNVTPKKVANKKAVK